MNQKNPYSAPQPQSTVTESAIRRKLFFIKAIFVLIATIAVFWFLSACRIETVKVTGYSHLSETEVMEATGIKPGKHLFAVTKKNISKNVAAISPYASGATVTKILPSTLIINVSEREARYYVEREGEYYLLSEDLIVLEKSFDELFAASEASCKLLLSAELKETTIGDALLFKSTVSEKQTQALLDIFADSPLTKSMTVLDIRDPYGLCAVVNNRYTLKLGSADQLAKKLSLCHKSVNYLASHMGKVEGILYATDAKQVSFVMTGVAS